MASIGMVIDGKYEIIAELGRGGMSIVYLAIDRRLNKQWAVKEAKKKPGNDSDIFELTPIAEAHLLKSLDHPNIVRIVDIIEQGGYIYIVEDFVEGKSLSEEVKRGPSSPELVVKWGTQLCDTFDYLHSRKPPIIYRDMKPANVQLQPDRKTVKLLDFGIAKTYKVQNVGDTHNLGTRGYAAPEQFDVSKQSDKRTDIFSLGVTLRALLMGKTPYDSEFYDDIRKQNPVVTDGLVKVIAKATDPNPEKRFQTAAEFKHALLHYHDKDAAVIRMKKRKLNSFRGLMASSISLFLAGLILLPISFSVRSVDYNDKLEKSQYIECININSSKYQAYFRYLEDTNKNGNLDTLEFDTETLNYHNISDLEKKREFALEAAYLKENFSSGQESNKNNIYKSINYYEDLAMNFSVDDENYSIDSVNSDMEQELNNCESIYQSIGKIRVFYSDIYSKADQVSNNSEAYISDDDKNKIFANFKAINNYVNNNKNQLLNEKMNEIFNKSHTKYENVSDFYEYMTKCQGDCLIANRSFFIANESQKDIDAVMDCINSESTYGKSQIIQNSLAMPKN